VRLIDVKGVKMENLDNQNEFEELIEPLKLKLYKTRYGYFEK
jgi:hypothetical protein